MKLLVASALGYAIFIFVLPILSRLYTPEQFGLLGVFLAICMTISSISASGYEYAILIAEDERDSSSLLIISCFFILTTCILVAIGIFFLNPYLLDFSVLRSLGWLLNYIPIMIFNLGVYNVFSYWLTRHQAFNLISVARFIQLFSIAFFQLVIGFSVYSATTGLIGGAIIGQQIASGFLIYQTIHTIRSNNNSAVSYRSLIENIKKYKNFLKFYTFSVLFNNGANYAPYLFLDYFFDSITVGFYSMTLRVLSTPVDIVNKAITPVFMQKVQEGRMKSGEASGIIKELSIRLSLVAILPTLILLVFAPQLFEVTLGKAWVVSGEYAQIMILLYFIIFIQNPTGTTIELYEKLQFRLMDQMAFFAISLISFGIGGWLGNIWMCLVLFSFLSSLRYLVLFVYAFRLSRKPRS